MNKKFDIDNDVSRVFAEKVDRQFRKDYARFLPPSQRLDKSKTKIDELNIKLIEAEEKIDSLNRIIEAKNRQINDFKDTDTKFYCKTEELHEEIRVLKLELEKKKRLFQNFNDSKLKEKLILNDYRTALGKYLTWFAYSEKQLESMRTIMQETGSWTEENRYKIYFSYKNIEPITVNDENVSNLCRISVLDYQGIEDVESISEFQQHLKFSNISTQTENFESGFLHCSEESSQNPSSQSQMLSQNSNQFYNLSTQDICYLNQNEKIQNLECENENLKEQLIILKNDLEKTKKQELCNKTIANFSNESKRIANFFKQKYKKEINHLKKKLAEFQPLCESETTRVYRYADNNPLDEAHDEHLINLATKNDAISSNNFKRRKLDSSTSEDDSIFNIQSDDSETIKDLRIKLEQHERSLKLQKDFAIQYRRIVTSLTGYQIKMREEGLCEVQSVYNHGGDFFCFKKRSDEAMDLLDNECARQWSSHVTNYLAKYDSVPAFLASVLLALIQSDASMLSSTFLNYTKDPQQDL